MEEQKCYLLRLPYSLYGEILKFIDYEEIYRTIPYLSKKHYQQLENNQNYIAKLAFQNIQNNILTLPVFNEKEQDEQQQQIQDQGEKQITSYKPILQKLLSQINVDDLCYLGFKTDGGVIWGSLSYWVGRSFKRGTHVVCSQTIKDGIPTKNVNILGVLQNKMAGPSYFQFKDQNLNALEIKGIYEKYSENIAIIKQIEIQRKGTSFCNSQVKTMALFCCQQEIDFQKEENLVAFNNCETTNTLIQVIASQRLSIAKTNINQLKDNNYQTVYDDTISESLNQYVIFNRDQGFANCQQQQQQQRVRPIGWFQYVDDNYDNSLIQVNIPNFTFFAGNFVIAKYINAYNNGGYNIDSSYIQFRGHLINSNYIQ